jgi:hypothetical protein
MRQTNGADSSELRTNKKGKLLVAGYVNTCSQIVDHVANNQAGEKIFSSLNHGPILPSIQYPDMYASEHRRALARAFTLTEGGTNCSFSPV